MASPPLVDPQEQSPLFAVLPVEVRQHIYAYALAFSDSDFVYSLRPTYEFLDDSRPPSRPLPGAMLACKRLHSEMASAVYGTALLRAQVIGYGRRVGLACHGTLRPARLHTLVLHIAVEQAYWNSWLRFVGEVLSCAPHVRTFIVDWEPRPVVGEGGRGYLAGHNRRMESQFFTLVGAMAELEQIRIHGAVGEAWTPRLKAHTSARIVCVPTRWWRSEEDGWLAVPPR